MLKAWRHGLMVSDTGTLYDDGTLCAAVQMAFQGNVARVQIRWSNKAPQPIDSLRVVIAPVPFLQTQDSGVPPSLPPLGAHPQSVALKVLDYFTDPPRLQVTYTSQGRASSAETKLPLSVCKFLTPVQCTKEQYFSVWGKIQGAPNEASQVLSSTRPGAPPPLEGLVTGVHFSVLPGIDPNPNNVCGACRMNIGLGDVFGVIRVEAAPGGGSWKVTVKASHPSVTATALRVLAEGIAG
mmetsp:Transcript_35454/g.90562  ORF Transcript_35454/g.90562 Transcript_35454/m.90562 type:complete len:238 (-) Transcript_35454:17-730(-)